MNGMEQHVSPAFMADQYGRIEWANKAMVKLIPDSAETLEELAEVLQFDASLLAPSIEQSQSLDAVLEIITADGPRTSVWHLSPAMVDGSKGELVFTVTIEIVDAQVTEDGLLARALRAHEPTFLCDSGATVIWANQGLADALSTPKAEVVGQSANTIAHALGLDRFEQSSKSKSLATPRGRMHISPVRGQDGQVTHYAVTLSETRVEVEHALGVLSQQLIPCGVALSNAESIRDALVDHLSGRQKLEVADAHEAAEHVVQDLQALRASLAEYQVAAAEPLDDDELPLF
jgi:PAS domain-containing protein